jgi:hypothetical protein
MEKVVWIVLGFDFLQAVVVTVSSLMAFPIHGHRYIHHPGNMGKSWAYYLPIDHLSLFVVGSIAIT